MATLDDVLSTIDANQGDALERLFALLAIPSISADPAHFPDCDRAADWLVRELRELGFEASRSETPGPPDGRRARQGQDAATRRTCCSTAITTCSRPIRWTSGKRRPFEPRLETRRSGRAHRRARRRGRQGPVDDLRRGLPGLPRERRPALQRQRAVRGRGGDRLALAARLPGRERQDAEGRPAARLRHRMWDAETPAITTMLRGLVLEEVVIHGGQPRPAFRPLRRRRDQSDPRARAHHRRSARRQRRGRRCPASTTASRNCPRKSPRNGATSISTTPASSARSACPFRPARRGASRWK